MTLRVVTLRVAALLAALPLVAAALAGCAGPSGGGPSGGGPSGGGGAEYPGSATGRPTGPRPAPEGFAARRAAVDALGRRAWQAMKDGEPARLLYDEIDLRVLLEPRAATRLTVRRAALAERIGSTADFHSLLDTAQYAGVCLQGAREAPAGGMLGLRSDGWVIDRVLIIGRRPSGRRIAAWLEGLWLYSDRGFGAVDLERVEEPRWEHSDLEIAPCDLSIRDDLPEIAR